ncbi:hypothetical protein WMY93_019379 [Mugilogobius chulae]|uniref:MULE transposase domain-containing protein n=1 Tax=Mugilogobius chulae TaxID=88201 RepID=A0AAW0NR02_9GOBI
MLRFEAVKSRLERKKASLMPPIPNNFQQRNALHEFLVFTTEENLRKLAQCRQIFMDGTFKTQTAPFIQFVTIHGFYMERALSFVMVLMTGETEEMYKAMLRHIKRRVQHVTGQRWMPNKVTTDFEMAMMEALRTELPTVRSSGCYFHFCQSLWRKVQELGLSDSSYVPIHSWVISSNTWNAYVRDNAIFPPAVWNVFGRGSDNMNQQPCGR